MNESKFDLELVDKRIIIRPVDILGRRLKPLNISLDTAMGLSEALRQLAEEAKIKCYH